MQPFDEGYMARREKQIQDLYMQRSMTWACLAVGLGLALISIPLLIRGAVFMFAGIRGQMAADRAIQEEYERLGLLYDRSLEKPKRGTPETVVRLSDDGELIAEDSSEDHTRAGTSRE
jgi:hypothetical protein